MRDRLIPPTALERWVEAFPHASVTRLESCGHFMPEEAADETLATIRAFLDAASRDGPAKRRVGTRSEARPDPG